MSELLTQYILRGFDEHSPASKYSLGIKIPKDSPG